MFQRLGLEDFKGIKKAEIGFGRITVLIGPNGTGKSSFAQALMVLRQSLGSSQLRVDGPLFNAGTFQDILNRESPTRQVGMLVSCNLMRDYPTLGIPKGVSFSYNAYFDPVVRQVGGSIQSPGKTYFTVQWKPPQAPTVTPNRITVPTKEANPVTMDPAADDSIGTP